MGGRVSEQTDIAKHLARFYSRQVARIAAQLRDMADEVERRGNCVYDSSQDSKPDYVNAAGQVVHKVQWGVANLPLDTLLIAAADVDREVRKPEVSGMLTDRNPSGLYLPGDEKETSDA